MPPSSRPTKKVTSGGLRDMEREACQLPELSRDSSLWGQKAKPLAQEIDTKE